MRLRGSSVLALAALVLCARPGLAQVTEYYHLDGIGAVRAVTGPTQVVLERHDFLPYGEEWCGSAVCANDAQAGGQARKFTGKERDTETDLDYFGGRYYGNRIARFTSIDPVYTWSENLADPQRWNRYAYVRGNPLRYVDPDGRTLTLSGLGVNQRKAERFANAGLMGQELVIAPDGTATLKSNGQAGPPTPEQSFLAAFLQEVIGDQANTHITLSRGSRTFTGHFNRQDIDVADIGMFGAGPAASATSKFAHEVAEQWAKQAKGITDPALAHSVAILFENAASGWTRSYDATFIGQSLTGTSSTPYDRGSTTWIVSMKVFEGNITSISRECLGPGCR